jgi:hypothetical protein
VSSLDYLPIEDRLVLFGGHNGSGSQPSTWEYLCGVATGIADEATPALDFQVSSSFPNPTAGSTAIRFTLPGPAPVRLQVYDVAGRLIRTLAWLAPGAGTHEVTWDGCNSNGKPMGAGVYFYRLEAGPLQATQRIVRLR